MELQIQNTLWRRMVTHGDDDGWCHIVGDIWPFPARHVGVAPFPVNNRPETGEPSRRSFPAAAGWCFVRPAVAHESWVAALSCRVNALSPRHALAGPIPVFSCFFADSETSIPGLTISRTHTPTPSRRAFLRPGFAFLLHSPRTEGGRNTPQMSEANPSSIDAIRSQECS